VDAGEAIFDSFSDFDPLEIGQGGPHDAQVVESFLFCPAFLEGNPDDEWEEDEDQEAENDPSPKGFEDGLGDFATGPGENGRGNEKEEGQKAGEFHNDPQRITEDDVADQVGT